MNMSIPKMNKNAVFANIFINSRVPLAEHIASAKRIYRVSAYRATSAEVAILNKLHYTAMPDQYAQI